MYEKNDVWVVRDLEFSEWQTKRFPLFLFKRPCAWAELLPDHKKINSEIKSGSNWNNENILY
jgi:hypothetical protein